MHCPISGAISIRMLVPILGSLEYRSIIGTSILMAWGAVYDACIRYRIFGDLNFGITMKRLYRVPKCNIGYDIAYDIHTVYRVAHCSDPISGIGAWPDSFILLCFSVEKIQVAKPIFTRYRIRYRT